MSVHKWYSKDDKDDQPGVFFPDLEKEKLIGASPIGSYCLGSLVVPKNTEPIERDKGGSGILNVSHMVAHRGEKVHREVVVWKHAFM